MRQSDLQKGLLALNEAYRSERPIEARISGQNYAELVARVNAVGVPADYYRSSASWHVTIGDSDQDR
jgi:hypothetical protein